VPRQGAQQESKWKGPKIGEAGWEIREPHSSRINQAPPKERPCEAKFVIFHRNKKKKGEERDRWLRGRAGWRGAGLWEIRVLKERTNEEEDKEPPI